MANLILATIRTNYFLAGSFGEQHSLPSASTQNFGINPAAIPISYLYPLRIPNESKSAPALCLQEDPNQVFELKVGKFAAFKEPVLIDGMLDFYLIRTYLG